MPSADRASVAVLGAAGFVGRELMATLERSGIKAAAVARGAPELAVDGQFHDVLDAAATQRNGGFDAVINLAYPNTPATLDHPAENAAIVRSLSHLVKDGGRLVHVSTLAVFGMALDRSVHAGPVAQIRDAPYVEAKIAAEHALATMQADRGLALDIVRLGNVFGYASGAWAVPLVHRLLTGRPVGIVGQPGLSNTTDVANVASYLAFLLQQGERERGVRYHHLAEFSRVLWTDWINPLARAMAVEPVFADRSVLRAPSSGREELAQALSTYSPRKLYRNLAAGSISGSWTRTVLRRLPAPLFARAKSSELVFATAPELDRPEQTFLSLMAAEQEFRSVLEAGWTPVLTREQSLARVLEWLARDWGR